MIELRCMFRLGAVVHVPVIPATWEATVHGQPGQLNEGLSQTKIFKKG